MPVPRLPPCPDSCTVYRIEITVPFPGPTKAELWFEGTNLGVKKTTPCMCSICSCWHAQQVQHTHTHIQTDRQNIHVVWQPNYQMWWHGANLDTTSLLFDHRILFLRILFFSLSLSLLIVVGYPAGLGVVFFKCSLVLTGFSIMFQLYPFVPKTLCWTCSSMHMDRWQSFNFCAQKAHFKSNSLKPGDARCYLDVSGPAARGGFFFAPRRHQESSRKNC